MALRILAMSPVDKQWLFAVLLAVVTGSVIADIGSGSGIVWTNNLVVTGTAFILVFGIAMPVGWARSVLRQRRLFVGQAGVGSASESAHMGFDGEQGARPSGARS